MPCFQINKKLLLMKIHYFVGTGGKKFKKKNKIICINKLLKVAL